jgi:predicted nucleotidyltransferase
MFVKEYSYQQKIEQLTEREKELKCLYRVEELVWKQPSEEAFLYELLQKIPNGWQHPALCKVKITFEGKSYMEPGWEETRNFQVADIEIDDRICGQISVYYTDPGPGRTTPRFLPEEQKLLNTLANRISVYLFNRKLENSLLLLNRRTQEQERLIEDSLSGSHDSHWKWRYRMAEAIAARTDFKAYDIRGIYLIGSVKEATAGPASDLDLLIHVTVRSERQQGLIHWLEGWSACLAEINYRRTGYRSEALLDVHFVTDEDIRNKTSYAVMIGTHENRAKPIRTE